MGARVQWRDAQGLQGVVELSYAEMFIGRAMECAIRTDDPMVSRRHARIYFQDGRHVIEDLGSANGIYIGDARTPMHALANGDTVRCGSLWLTYQNDGLPAAMGGQAPGGGLGVGPQGTQMLVAPTGPPNLGGSMGPGGFGTPSPAAAPPFGASPPMSPPTPAFGGPPAGFGGAPPSFGAGPPPAFGGPPPAFGGPPPPIVPPGATSFGGGAPSIGGGPPPPMGAPAPMGSTVDPQSEMMRMQRRIDQLTSEVRILRGGGDGATRMEELEEKVSRLERDNGDLNEKCNRLERMASQGGGSVAIGTAQLRLGRAEEVVNGLNDVLSELRINILAAEGEVEQWAQSLPRASFDLVRESLRGSRAHMETAKELMRMLRAEGR